MMSTELMIWLKMRQAYLLEIGKKPPNQTFFYSTVDTDETPESAMRPGFLTTFAMSTDQGSKLGLGKNKTIICMYSSYQVL